MEQYIDEPKIIVLCDSTGFELLFELVETVEYNGNSYVVLLPADCESDEYTILRINGKDENGENEYVGISDNLELTRVFNLFTELIDNNGSDKV